jgi:hypothetical protein
VTCGPCVNPLFQGGRDVNRSAASASTTGCAGPRNPRLGTEGAAHGWGLVLTPLRRRHRCRRGRTMGQLQPHRRDGQQAVCRRIASEARAHRPRWRRLHRIDDRFRVWRLGISSQEPASPSDRSALDRLRRIQHRGVVLPSPPLPGPGDRGRQDRSQHRAEPHHDSG